MKPTQLLHPFLFAAFPLLFLDSRNLDEVAAGELVLPAVVLCAATALLLGFIYLVCRDWGKAAFLVSVSWLLFFSYGAFHSLIRDWVLFGHEVGRHRYLLLVWVLIFSVGVLFAVRRPSFLGSINRFFSRFAIILVAIAVLNIGWYSVSVRNVAGDDIIVEGTTAAPPEVCPDIYYIVLDGYARADVLQDLYRYDNSHFLGRLTRMGFYVAEESRSNYPMTGLSMASSLDFTYLDDYIAQLDPSVRESCDLRPLISRICSSRSLRFLKRFGYSFVTFSPGVAVVDVKTADTYIRPQFRVSAFQNALVNMTPLPIFLARLHIKSQYDLHRERILFMLENLPGIASREDRESPVFVYCHILCPHPPFVFQENGDPIEQTGKMAFLDGDNIWRRQDAGDEYREKYIGQLRFVSEKILSVVEDILERSAEPPVIILQSDHGPGLELDWSTPSETTYWERLAILNAYYLPGGGEQHLYPGISPVNTFRVVFNHFFGADHELLEDKCYFMLRNQPYQLKEVTDMIPDRSGSDFKETQAGQDS